MEEIKVGEWARTIGGIIQRVTKIKKCEDGDVHIHLDNNFIFYRPKEIVKHSKNIIDLIEVGDYVNGGKVVEIDASKDWIDNSEEDRVLRQEDIKSIVTKEQFSSVEYRLEEGDK